MNFTTRVKSLLSVLLLSLLVGACNDDNQIFTNDYSDAPPLPDTTNALSKTITPEGLKIYTITKGDTTTFEITIRDNVFAYFTSRTASNDNIVQSTYANGITTPFRISNVGGQNTVTYVQGRLYDGVAGMYEGERRVLVYPDSLTSINRELIIDFELEAVIY